MLFNCFNLQLNLSMVLALVFQYFFMCILWIEYTANKLMDVWNHRVCKRSKWIVSIDGKSQREEKTSHVLSWVLFALIIKFFQFFFYKDWMYQFNNQLSLIHFTCCWVLFARKFTMWSKYVGVYCIQPNPTELYMVCGREAYERTPWLHGHQ